MRIEFDVDSSFCFAEMDFFLLELGQGFWLGFATPQLSDWKNTMLQFLLLGAVGTVTVFLHHCCKPDMLHQKHL